VKFPTVFAGEVTGTIMLMHPSVVPQLSLLTYTVEVGVVIPDTGTTTFTTFSG
jgi:hypothetical protein